MNAFAHRVLLLRSAHGDFNGGGRVQGTRPAGLGIVNVMISMRDRGKNRKPLQRGRNLSIEAIQTVQALKRGARKDPQSLHNVFDSMLKRLLKFDMMAVLRELLRQNECFLALQVFEEVRKESWYKPQVSLYADMISVLASEGLLDEVELLFAYLKVECSYLELDTEGFNGLLTVLMSTPNTTGLAMEWFYSSKELGWDLDRSFFRILINGLESNGETDLSAVVRLEAEKYFGVSTLDFLEEETN
ncbi:protein THYLAKOID ASSEMBLY 8, chloroplastic-like [Malania oleifera]|uniref:protein THYLAKOID ASSEMBLY 8, chloroplastic-like n=1 Tax=Malania oleifera TaxID=397392 RepID=UPI0025AE4753|nr:protein THYLAKOID ASSEMBLY 8, chloroplastic-like [Malania oleifera]